MTETSAATGAGEESGGVHLSAFELSLLRDMERMERAIPDEFCLDPPDGGDVKPWESVQRMADALAALREENGRVRLANLDCVDHFNQMEADLAASRQREEELKAMIDWMENMDPRLVEEARTWFGNAALSEKPAAEKDQPQ